MNNEGSAVLRSLEYFRSGVDAAKHSLSEGVVSGAYNSTLGALMHLLNFADTWYSSQAPPATAEIGDTRNANLTVADDEKSFLIHLLITRRICDLTGKLVAFSVQNRLLTRDSILTKVLTNRKISDTSSALLFRLENLTDAFGRIQETDGRSARPNGFPEGQPDSLAFIETSANGGYKDLIGVDRQVRDLHRQIDAARTAKTSTVIMLYGPPGTGKTSLVSAAAKENGLAVATVATSNLGGEFIGEREQNVTDLFDYLEKVATDYILFIDEADSFLPETYENNTQARLTRVLTINRMLRLVGKNDGVARVVVLATNYAERIAKDVAGSCSKIYLAAPYTIDQMKELISFYKNRTNMNLTRRQLNYLSTTALALGYAPAHVSLLMQRFLTNSIIKLLNNRIILQRSTADMFDLPIYMIEHGKRYEGGTGTQLTVARVTDEPRNENDTEARAAAWERGESICFPVPDLNVDYRSVLGGRARADVHLPQPPCLDSEFDDDGTAVSDSGICDRSDDWRTLAGLSGNDVENNELFTTDPIFYSDITPEESGKNASSINAASKDAGGNESTTDNLNPLWALDLGSSLIDTESYIETTDTFDFDGLDIPI